MFVLPSVSVFKSRLRFYCFKYWWELNSNSFSISFDSAYLNNMFFHGLRHKLKSRQKTEIRTCSTMHLALCLYSEKTYCPPLPLFPALRGRGQWAADENTLAWHPCLKWTDTINPRDSKDPLTEQDKVSASAHSYTWPVAHEHSLALMAYIMHTAAKTGCTPRAALFLRRPRRISGYGTEATFYLFNRSDCYDAFCAVKLSSPLQDVGFCYCLITIL